MLASLFSLEPGVGKCCQSCLLIWVQSQHLTSWEPSTPPHPMPIWAPFSSHRWFSLGLVRVLRPQDNCEVVKTYPCTQFSVPFPSSLHPQALPDPGHVSVSVSSSLEYHMEGGLQKSNFKGKLRNRGGGSLTHCYEQRLCGQNAKCRGNKAELEKQDHIVSCSTGGTQQREDSARRRRAHLCQVLAGQRIASRNTQRAQKA